MQNYFELFSLAVDFEINNKVLEEQYQKQVTIFHPDKFASKGDKEKSLALQNTALINTAFDTLKHPLKRASYLLELNGINVFEETDTSMNTQFLLDQIKLREQLEVIEQSQDDLALEKFIAITKENIVNNIKNIGELFKIGDLLHVKNAVRELKFYIQLDGDAKKLMDAWL